MLKLDQSHWTSETYLQYSTTKEWKEFVLEHGDDIVVNGCTRYLKAESIGHGVVIIHKLSEEESRKILRKRAKWRGFK